MRNLLVTIRDDTCPDGHTIKVSRLRLADELLMSMVAIYDVSLLRPLQRPPSSLITAPKPPKLRHHDVTKSTQPSTLAIAIPGRFENLKGGEKSGVRLVCMSVAEGV